MREVALIIFLVFGLSTFGEDIFGQEFYKWVDDKGTVHFSDNPTYARAQQQKEHSKENGIEVLKRSEPINRAVTAPGGKTIIINYSQGTSSGGGESTAVTSRRS